MAIANTLPMILLELQFRFFLGIGLDDIEEPKLRTKLKAPAKILPFPDKDKEVRNATQRA